MGVTASALLLAPLGICAAVVALFVFRASPRITFVAWTLVLFFVPIWVGVSAGFFWSALTLITLAAIVANLAELRLVPVDGLVAAFALLVLALQVLSLASLSASVIAILQWIVPYAWGRIVLARLPAAFLTRTIAAVATAAAVLALVEVATGVNAFVLIPGSGAVDEWSQLQSRASFVRVEGAFGHSIALGASLAMSCSFIIAARWRTPVMLLSLLAVVGAVVATFSRIGLVTTGLTIALSVMLLHGVSRGAKWMLAAAGAAAVAVILPFVESVFSAAGDEAGGSAEYRSGLLSLLSLVRPLGAAADWSGLAVDGVYLGAYAESVDNALLLIALRFGWLPAMLVAGVFIAIAIATLKRPANPASVAVVCQIPALFAVALITQFGMLVWFLAGLAAAWRATEPQRLVEPGATDAPRRTMSRTNDSSDVASRR